VEFRILGPLEVAVGRDVLPIPGGRERTLLARLVLSAGEVVAPERLIEAVWGGDPPAGPVAALQVHVSRLRRALRTGGAADEAVVTRSGGYVLAAAEGQVDAFRFEALRRQARDARRAGQDAAAAAILREALGLWRGRVLADLPDPHFALGDIARLEEARLVALEDRIEADLVCGAHRELVGELEALTGQWPLRERLWALRMTALYRSGRRAEALRAYQDVRRHYAEELGLEPGAELRELEAAVLRQDLRLGPSVDAPPARSPTVRPARPAARRGGRPALPHGPRLVGREAETEALEAELDRAAAGEFRVVLVLADAGVGKSRLVAQFLADRPEGVAVLAGRAHTFGVTTSFGPWVEAMERYLRPMGAAELADLGAGVAGDLAGMLPAMASTGAVPPGGAEAPSFRFLQAFGVLLGRLGREGPVVVVLDDVHLADASSFEALHYLARQLADVPVLVVATARPAELRARSVGHDVLLGLEDEGFLRRLRLTPLDAAAVGALASDVLAQPAPPALVDWLAERSRGVALFALGLLQALLDEGADLAAPALRSLPEGLAERVSGRLARLDDRAREMVELLATVGRSIGAGDLYGLAGVPPADGERALQALAGQGLIAEDEQGRDLLIDMEHPLMAEIVLRSIGPVRRRSLHRRVARHLHAAGRVGEAAGHFGRCADVGDAEAIASLQEAMRQAESRQAYREALSILGILVDVIPPGSDQWLEVLDAMSWQAEWVVDHRADTHAVLGIAALRAIDAVVAESPDPYRRATVKFRLSSFLSWGTGELEEAERCCREALRLFAEAGTPAPALVARNELAWIRGMGGDIGAWAAGVAEVAAAAEESGVAPLAMLAQSGIGYSSAFQGDFDRCEAAFRRAVDIARAAGEPHRLTLCLAALAVGLAVGGRPGEAFPLIAEAKAANAAYGDNVLLEWETICRWMAGDYPGALRSAQESVGWNPAGMSRRRALGTAYAALAAVEAGQPVDARRYLGLAAAAYDGIDWFFFRDYCDYALALVDWQAGARDAALPRLDATAAAILSLDARPFAAFPLADLAQLATECRQPDVAARAARELAGIAPGLGRPLYRATAATAAAWAALAAGDAKAATDEAGTAVELLEGSSCAGFLARAHDVLARARAAAGDDPASAAKAAGELYDRCGARWRRDRMPSDAALTSTGAPR